MIDFIKKHWILILSEMLVVTIFCLFYGRFGDIFVDSFRETYIPEQMLSGKILYKDIFCIYPPLGYMINALLFKIFGTNLSVIYFAGLFSTMGIVYFIYKISKMFFDNLFVCGTILFFISGFVLSPNVFNPFFPYSSGIMYGLLFTIGSIYFALNKKFQIAYILCGLALCSKAEFLLLLPALLYFSRQNDLIKNILSFAAPIALTIGLLFIQGVRFEDLITALNITQLIGQTEAIRNFYFSMGLVPNIAHLPLYIVNFIKFILPINWNFYQEIIMWIFPTISILFVLRYKKLNIQERFLIIASVLISLKVFFALTLQAYGVYFIPFALISVGILIQGRTRKIFSILLVLWAIIIGFNNSKALRLKNFELESPNGIVKVNPESGKDTKDVLDFLKLVPKNSRVVVYPECLGINYLSGKKSDNKFYSLIPLYVETFGEDIIIKRLELKKPDYIIISDYNTFAYGYNKFGKNYARKIYQIIKRNYKYTKNINNYEIYSIQPFNY